MNKVILFLSAVVVSFSALVATAASLNYEEAMSKGRVAFNDGCIEDALRYFELALEDDMNTPHEREQAKAEIRRCQDILEQRNGVDADARFQDGLISAQQLLMNKKYAECRSKCEELLRIYPNRADELEPLLSRCNAYFAERQAEANAAAEKERQYKAEFSELQYLIIDEKWQEAKNKCETMLSKYPEHKIELEQIQNRCNMELGIYGYIDLGISVLWAECNVGAAYPEDCGNYYAWGETSTKNEYTYKNYKYHKVYIGEDIAGTEYDVSTNVWGQVWQIPSKEQWKELIDKCSWEWTNRNGIDGYKIVGKNGNSIFLPVSGWYSGFEIVTRDSGMYWSSTLDHGDEACCLWFDYRTVYLEDFYREVGYCVRPIRVK